MTRERGHARQNLGPQRRRRGFRTSRASPRPVQGHDDVALNLGDEPVHALGDAPPPVPQRSRVPGVHHNLRRSRGRRDDDLPGLAASLGGVRQELDPPARLQRLPQLDEPAVHEREVPFVGVGEPGGGAEDGDEGQVVLVGALHGVLERLVVHRALRGLNPQEDVPTPRVDALEVEPAEPLWRNLGSDVVPEWWDLGGERGAPGQGGSLVRLSPRTLLFRQSRHASD